MLGRDRGFLTPRRRRGGARRGRAEARADLRGDREGHGRRHRVAGTEGAPVRRGLGQLGGRGRRRARLTACPKTSPAWSGDPGQRGPQRSDAPYGCRKRRRRDPFRSGTPFVRRRAPARHRGRQLPAAPTRCGRTSKRSARSGSCPASKRWPWPAASSAVSRLRPVWRSCDRRAARPGASAPEGTAPSGPRQAA